jgi:hypothetical protein
MSRESGNRFCEKHMLNQEDADPRAIALPTPGPIESGRQRAHSPG